MTMPEQLEMNVPKQCHAWIEREPGSVIRQKLPTTHSQSHMMNYKDYITHNNYTGMEWLYRKK